MDRTEDMLFVGYDKDPMERDLTALCVFRNSNNKREMLVARMGDNAKKLYRILTDQSCKFDITIYGSDE